MSTPNHAHPVPLRRRAGQVGALGAALLLAACTGQGGGAASSSPTAGASSGASGSASAPASTSTSAAGQGALVKTTSAEVAGFDLAQHQVDQKYTSPDRTTVASSAKPAGFADPPAGQGRQRYLSQKLSWTACGTAQCASVLVPLDWDHPDGQAITLKMKKVPAEGTRTGTLFVNPGGPGGSGQDMVAPMSTADFPGHDLIGWDPRGSGESTPVKCGTGAQTDAYVAMDTSPDDASEWSAAEAGYKAFAAQCRQNSGALLDHISTIDNVRDLDYLRYLVGDKKLDYLGVSYGTYIGSLYAEMYPQRTGRMVLDSAVNITDDESVIQQMGFDLALKNYATWCAQNACGLGGSQAEVLKTVTGVLDKLDARPLTVNGRQLTQALGMTGMMTYLYFGAEGYDQLTQAVSQARDGNGAMLMVTADLMNGRDARGTYSSMTYAFPAIACTDANDPGLAGAKKELPLDIKKAPILGPYFGPNLMCTWWSAKPAPELKILGRGAAPIVVLGATGDPATPYQQAVWMAKQLQSGVLVTWKGAGHSAWELGNDCVKDAVRNYVNKGAVPTDGLTC